MRIFNAYLYAVFFIEQIVFSESDLLYKINIDHILS